MRLCVIALSSARSASLNGTSGARNRGHDVDVTSVVFDLDDTLYEEKAAKVAAECRVASRLAERLGVADAEALTLFVAAKRETLRQRHLGPARNDRRRWIAAALERRSLHDDVLVERLATEYWATLFDNLRPYADALIALPVLADRFELWIATNEHQAQQQLKLDRLGIAGYFAGVVSADQVGHEKPAPEFFAHLAEVLGKKPESIVFVGDNPRTDIVGACQAGLRCIHFRRGAYANFDLSSLPGCEPTWTVDYLTEIALLLGP